MLRHRKLQLLACCAVLMSWLTAVVVADDSRPNGVDETESARQAAAKRADELVRKLGDSSFQVRRTATQELIAIGLPALDALQRASKDDDLEVRYRAGRLFHQVRLQVHSRRLERYLADADSISVDLIPGLKIYSEVVGADDGARKLFVEMHRAEAELFVLLGTDRKQLEEKYDNRAHSVRYLLTTPAARRKIAATTAALMFLGTQPDITVSNRAVSAIYGLANYNEFRTALSAKPTAFRKLVGHWIATEKAGSTQQRLILAMRYSLDAGLIPALTALKAPATPYEMQYALLTVGRFGGREHVPAVEKLFQNRGALTRVGGGKKVKFTAEVRDVALAVAVHLTGRDPRKEFGFPRLSKNAQYLFNPNSAGFNDEASRTVAFKKWAARSKLAEEKVKSAAEKPEKPPAD